MNKIPSYVWIILTLVVGVSFLFALVAGESQKPSRIEQKTIDLAQELNLDVEKFKKDIKSEEINKIVETQKSDVLKRLGDSASTPAVFVNSQYFNLTSDPLALENKLLELSSSRKQEEPKILVEVFSDYNCSHCFDYESYIIRIESNEILMSNIDLQKKSLPFLKDSSILYARASESARLQGKFNEYSKRLFEIAQGRVMKTV